MKTALLPASLLLVSSLTMANENIIFAGDSLDIVSCGPRHFTAHKNSVEVEKIDEKTFDIYQDGLYSGECEEYKVDRNDEIRSKLFSSFSYLDVLTPNSIFNLYSIGTCTIDPYYGVNVASISHIGANYLDYSKTDEIKNTYQSYITRIAQKSDVTEITPEIKISAFKLLVKNGFCGNFDHLSDELRETYSKNVLGQQQLGIEIFYAEGSTFKELKEMGYGVKSFYNGLSLTLDDLIETGFSVKEITQISDLHNDIRKKYSIEDLMSQGFSLKDLSYAGLFKIKDLKSHFTLGQFRAAGYDWGHIKDMGFTLKESITAGATIRNLTAYYRSISGNPYGLKDLAKHFSAAALVNAGFKYEDVKKYYPEEN